MKKNKFHTHFFFNTAAVTPDQWSLTDENRTCGIKTLDSARLVWLDWTGLDWTGVCWCVRTAAAAIESKLKRHCRVFVSLTGLDWTGLDWIGLDWIGLDWTGLDWTGLCWCVRTAAAAIESKLKSHSRVFVSLTGLDWIGLDWIGLDWTGLDWTGLCWCVRTFRLRIWC